MADSQNFDSAGLEKALGIKLPENCEISIRDLDAPKPSDGELSDADLEVVAGGMSSFMNMAPSYMMLRMNRARGGMTTLALAGSARGMRG